MHAIRVASWNIRNFRDAGESSESDRRYDRIASLLEGTHVCSVQEVLDSSILETLKQRYMAPDHDYVISPVSMGSSNRSEYYAFVYDRTVVEVVRTEMYRDERKMFKRRPFVGQFRHLETGFTFYVLNIHVLYGDGKADRRPEVEALGTIAAQLDHQSHVIFAGDFNLPPDDTAWRPLKRQGYTSLFRQPARTTVGGVSLLDNIWVRARDVYPLVISIGIVKFDETWYPRDVQRARREVSDHRLIWMDMRVSFLDEPVEAALIRCAVCTRPCLPNTCSTCVDAPSLCNERCFTRHIARIHA